MANPPILTAAVLGLGAIGSGREVEVADAVLGQPVPHTHVGAYLASKKTRLVAVCDPSLDRRRDFVRVWGPDVTRPVRSYAWLDDLLQHEKVDLLSIAVPDDQHASSILRAAPHVRGILCEKPLATSVRDADAALEACRRHGTAMTVNYTRRWIPLYREAHRLAQSGAIGRLNSMIASLSSARPMLFRNGSHLLDLMLFCSGEQPTAVSAELGRGFRAYGQHYSGDGGTDPRTDPSGSALIRFTNDVVGHLQVSEGLPILEMSIFGDKGRIRVGTHARELWTATPGDSAIGIQPMRETQYRVGDTLAAVEELVAAVTRGDPNLSSAEVARQSVAILEAILQSSHQNGSAVGVESLPRRHGGARIRDAGDMRRGAT